MTVFGEIRDHEFGAPDASHDLVGDLVVVLLSIDPKRFEPAISFDGRKNTNVVGFSHRWIEPHGYETSSRRAALLRHGCLQTSPTRLGQGYIRMRNPDLIRGSNQPVALEPVQIDPEVGGSLGVNNSKRRFGVNAKDFTRSA
jgi:hypothetical protein